MALSFGNKDYIEGGVLAFVIVLNVTIGFWQEYRAEKRMDALRALSSPSAMVLRDGKTQVISKYVSPPAPVLYEFVNKKVTRVCVTAPKSSPATSSSSRWATRSPPTCASSKP